MTRKTVTAALAVFFVLAAVIDLVAGYWPRTISSLALAAAFLLIAAGVPDRQPRAWTVVHVLFGIAVAAFVYRLVLWAG